MIIDKLIGIFSNDLAIDLGTANTIVALRDGEVVVNEPSVVAVRSDYGGFHQIVAIGSTAKEMVGKTPMNISAIRPLKDGVIADFDMAEAMIRKFIEKAHNRTTLISPRVVICVPYGLTQVERKAVRESAISAGAREIYMIEEPMAAALGIGLDIKAPKGNFIVDIGGGTTEIGVVSLGGLVVCKSIKIAGDKFDSAIVNYLKRNYSLIISERDAEEIKIAVGSALPLRREGSISINGRDQFEGSLKSVAVSSEEIREAIQKPLQEIADELISVLELVPTELIKDILNSGVILTGGGSLIRQLDQYLSQKTRLPVYLAEDPLLAVAQGTSMLLNDDELLQELTFS
jgi:rod shape-determining protein MreB